jgi:hypothetical protein
MEVQEPGISNPEFVEQVVTTWEMTQDMLRQILLTPSSNYDQKQVLGLSSVQGLRFQSSAYRT